MDVIYREMIKFGVVGPSRSSSTSVWRTCCGTRCSPTRSRRPRSSPAPSRRCSPGSATGSGPSATAAAAPPTTRSLLFFGVNVVALGISAVTLTISHYGLGFTSILADNVATIIGIGLGTLFRFWAYRKFVFAGEPL